MHHFTEENLKLLEILGFERQRDDHFRKKISEGHIISAVPYSRGDIWFQVRLEPGYAWIQDSDFYAQNITGFIENLYSIGFNRGITTKENQILRIFEINR